MHKSVQSSRRGGGQWSIMATAVAMTVLPAAPAHADTTGVYLPQAPRGQGGEDSIETSGGTKCRQSIASNGAYLDIGAAVSGAQQESGDQVRSLFREPDAQGTVYLRVTFPLGKKPVRIDCTRLYEMELAKLREELALLRMAVE